MTFQAIAGQETAKRMLQSGLRSDSLAHAYIFSGPAGTGKREMAVALAQAIFCTRQGDDACGQCLECRKVEHGNHPDFIRLEPDGSSIKIEQIRELQKEFSFRASSRLKVYMIGSADLMTVQAANSLLKFLEEPPTPAVAVLVTDNGHALLPTIQSRAQWVPFHPLSTAEMSRILIAEGHPAVLVASAVHLASGVGAARDLIQLNWFAEIRNVVIQLAKESSQRFTAALLTVHHKVVKTDLMDHVDILLDLFMLWFKDMLNIQCGRRDRIVFADQTEWMAKTAFSQNAAFWVTCMEHTLESKKKIRFHVHPQLALEQFMIEVKGG